MMTLSEFRNGLEPFLTDPCARPFVCTGSPLKCRSFIIGTNAATRLDHPFSSYWSDENGFDRDKFDADYLQIRSRRGTRSVIEAIAAEIGPCLETNLYSTPTPSGVKLSAKDRENPVITYLFDAIKPELVFVHGNEPIRFFKEVTGATITEEVKDVTWQGHEFAISSRSGPLYTLGPRKGSLLGSELARYLSP